MVEFAESGEFDGGRMPDMRPLSCARRGGRRGRGLPSGGVCPRLNVMIDVSRQQDVTVIRLGPSYPTLDDDVLDEIGGLLLTEAVTADPPRLVLDLSDTTYFGSTFVEVLVRVWKRLSEREGTLVLCGLQPFCAEVLHISRVDTLWQSFPTRDQAVAAVRGVANEV